MKDKVLDFTKSNVVVKKPLLTRGGLKKIIPFKIYQKLDTYIFTNKVDPLRLLLKQIVGNDQEVVVIAPCLSESVNIINSMSKANIHHDINNIILKPKTKAIYLDNPNPITGRVYSHNDLFDLINEASKNDVAVIVNESESVFVKGFTSLANKKSLIRNLYVINTLKYNDAYLSIILGKMNVLHKIKITNLIMDKKYKMISKYYSSKRVLKKIKKLRELNYNILKNYCEKRSVIYMKNSKSSYFTLNVAPYFFEKRNVKCVLGRDIGLGEKYVALSLLVESKKVINLVYKRLK